MVMQHSFHRHLLLNGLSSWIISLICTGWITVSLSFVPSMNKTIKFMSEQGNIAVYDKAMPAWITLKLESFLMSGERWHYQYPDKLANVTQRGGGNLDWLAPLSPEFLMKTKSWLVFEKILEDFTGLSDYMAYQVQGVMLRRGDFPTIIEGETGTDDVLCNLFLGQGFTKSGMLFFDEKGEIVKAVATKFNRIVIWNATLDFRLKQPAFESFKTKYSLLIRFTRSSTKMANELSYIKDVRETEKRQKLDSFPKFDVQSHQYTNEYFEKHLTRKFYDRDGGVISVFDGIMNETELQILRKYLMKYNTGYSNTGFSTQEHDDLDNVSWIVMFKPEGIFGTKILSIVKGMARYLSGEDGWFPYDVSLNMIQKTFHTRIHTDCEEYEVEYTFLLYLNPNWTEEMYGETIFLNQIQDLKMGKGTKVIRDKAYETIVSVKPRYGRMVMFRNNIPHSARPPSPDFHGSRYTFAIKVSRSKIIGLAKILRELLEFKEGQNDEGGMLYNQIHDQAGSNKIQMEPEELRTNIAKYREVREKDTVSQKEAVLTSILRKQYVVHEMPAY